MQIQVNERHPAAKLPRIEFNVIELINNVSEFQSKFVSFTGMSA